METHKHSEASTLVLKQRHQPLEGPQKLCQINQGGSACNLAKETCAMVIKQILVRLQHNPTSCALEQRRTHRFVHMHKVVETPELGSR